MIRLRNIHKSYTIGANRLHVLKGIDLDIDAGELVSVMGSSGSGKSTLMNILGLLDSYDEGTYHLDGELLADLSERQAAQYRSRFIGFVFQSFHLIQFKTAAENVALPLYYQGVSRRERNRVALEYLEKVGLADRAEHLPRELSGGQQQRVAIARAIVSDPTLLICDEPTGDLDRQSAEEILGLLQVLNREHGKTIVMVTHDPKAAEYATHTLHLDKGTLVEQVEHAI